MRFYLRIRWGLESSFLGSACVPQLNLRAAWCCSFLQLLMRHEIVHSQELIVHRLDVPIGPWHGWMPVCILVVIQYLPLCFAFVTAVLEGASLLNLALPHFLANCFLRLSQASPLLSWLNVIRVSVMSRAVRPLSLTFETNKLFFVPFPCLVFRWLFHSYLSDLVHGRSWSGNS